MASSIKPQLKIGMAGLKNIKVGSVLMLISTSRDFAHVIYTLQLNETLSFSNRASKDEVRNHYREKKFIVFQSCLLELFEKCPLCGGVAEAHVEKPEATLIHIQQKCLEADCKYQRPWKNQLFVKNMPACNLLMSGTIANHSISPPRLSPSVIVYCVL